MTGLAVLLLAPAGALAQSPSGTQYGGGPPPPPPPPGPPSAGASGGATLTTPVGSAGASGGVSASAASTGNGSQTICAAGAAGSAVRVALPHTRFRHGERLKNVVITFAGGRVVVKNGTSIVFNADGTFTQTAAPTHSVHFDLSRLSTGVRKTVSILAVTNKGSTLHRGVYLRACGTTTHSGPFALTHRGKGSRLGFGLSGGAGWIALAMAALAAAMLGTAMRRAARRSRS